MVSENEIIDQIVEAINTGFDRQYMWSKKIHPKETQEYVLTTLAASFVYDVLQYQECVQLEANLFSIAANAGLKPKKGFFDSGKVDLLINYKNGNPRGVVEFKKSISKASSFNSSNKNDIERIDALLVEKSTLSFGVLGGIYVKKVAKSNKLSQKELLLDGVKSLQSGINEILKNSKIAKAYANEKYMVPLYNNDEVVSSITCPLCILLKKKA